jgi:hypothetical protein
MDFAQEEIDRMVGEADVNGDGRIDYNEFAALWKAHVVHVHYSPLVQRVNSRRASKRIKKIK